MQLGLMWVQSAESRHCDFQCSGRGRKWILSFLLGELGSFFLSRSFLLPVRYFAERTPQLLGSEPVIVIWPSARPCMFQSEAASRLHPTSRGPFSWCRTYFFGPAGRGVGGRHLGKATCKVKRQGWIFQYDDVCGILNKLDGWMGAVGLTPVWGIDRLLRPEGAGRMGHWATVREESVRATRPTQLQLVVHLNRLSIGLVRFPWGKARSAPELGVPSKVLTKGPTIRQREGTNTQFCGNMV